LSIQDLCGEIVVSQQVRAELVRLLPRLRRFACGLTGSVDDGDDLVQSACERALTRLDQFRPGTRLDSWMYRIVQNLWIDQRRARQARPEAGMEPADLAALAVGDAERELSSRLAMATVQRAVRNLSEDQRSVLLLVCVEGLSYKAAAEVLDVPLGTVMSRLARARLAVGQALDGEASAATSRAKG
jgi:RNA polymerase sigma-70 factor (ECF subfamily)